MTGEEADRRFASGQRRSGEFVYSTQCPGCQACEPLRLDVNKFQASSSQRRAWRRGLAAFTVEFGPLVNDEARVELFNRHRQGRGLERESPIDLESYAWGLGRSCFDAFEIDYYFAGQLSGVAICDRGGNSLSAVYTYYDPALLRLSPGTFSVLRQIEFCRENGLQYLYLGFFIAESKHMAYKSNFRPHERLIGGKWLEFD
jgi:arginine-tRNA-protein transferase